MWHLQYAPFATLVASGSTSSALIFRTSTSLIRCPTLSTVRPPSFPTQRLQHYLAKSPLIKTYLTRKSQLTARNFLLSRLDKVSWLEHSSPSTFDVLYRTPVKVIPSFARLAILHWLIDSEADMPFRLRPHVTLLAPCRCGWCPLLNIP